MCIRRYAKLDTINEKKSTYKKMIYTKKEKENTSKESKNK